MHIVTHKLCSRCNADDPQSGWCVCVCVKARRHRRSRKTIKAEHTHETHHHLPFIDASGQHHCSDTPTHTHARRQATLSLRTPHHLVPHDACVMQRHANYRRRARLSRWRVSRVCMCVCERARWFGALRSRNASALVASIDRHTAAKRARASSTQ